MEKRKRRLGDRNDGRRLRSLDAFTRVAPYIMVERNTANNMFMDSIDIDEIEKYIHQKRREGLAGFGIMHVLMAAYVRGLAQRPIMNRFIAGQRIYARNDIEINLIVKRALRSDAPETSVKIIPPPDATAEDIYNLFQREISEGKTDDDSSFDSLTKVLNFIPGIFLKFAIWLIKFFDYFGLLPRKLTLLSPFHASIFITSMGSLGIPPVFHHLYDIGNIPVFMSFGAKQKRYETLANGTVVERHFITCTWNTDDRICDGFNYVASIKLLKSILKNPYQLDERPKEIVDDVD